MKRIGEYARVPACLFWRAYYSAFPSHTTRGQVRWLGSRFTPIISKMLGAILVGG